MSDFVVNLPVPYKSEWDADATETNNDCGPSSASMVMGLYGENHTTNEIFEKTQAGSGLITVQQLLNGIKAFGFECEYKTGVSLADLQNYLKQGIPPIILIKAKYLTSRQDQGFGGGHFIVLDGYRDDGVTANDPDFYGDFRAQGDHHFYTMSEFLNAWGKCHEDGNPDNSIVLIHPKRPVIDYEKLYNEKREECDDGWNIVIAATDTLNIPVPANPTHEDKIEIKNNIQTTIQAIQTAKQGYKEKLDVFSKAGYNSLNDIQSAIDAEKEVSQPVVTPSTPTVSVPVTYPGQNTPPVQASQIPLPMPIKPSLGLWEYIVFALTNIINTLKRI